MSGLMVSYQVAIVTPCCNPISYLLFPSRIDWRLLTPENILSIRVEVNKETDA
jgi:hypothetical protein